MVLGKFLKKRIDLNFFEYFFFCFENINYCGIWMVSGFLELRISDVINVRVRISLLVSELRREFYCR